MADYCNANIAQKIIQNTDLIRLEEQVRKYGPANRYELRVLLYFLSRGPSESRRIFGEKLKDIVAPACEPKDSETESIARAYIRLEPVTGSALAQELGIEIVEEQKERGIEELKHRRLELMEAYRERDAQNIDYDIEIFNHDTPGPVATG